MPHRSESERVICERPYLVRDGEFAVLKQIARHLFGVDEHRIAPRSEDDRRDGDAAPVDAEGASPKPVHTVDAWLQCLIS